ncbi:SET and MYND domain-containing protein 5 [Cimex lectularius]|uniref:SET domain-containing protein n=1 Tax=Cimex lectularius TaxID=79782 RepID=A0A8I6RCL4_CIMLE|nr:SET and MYND domain-containing protein 5 [Cimex lectularius]
MSSDCGFECKKISELKGIGLFATKSYREGETIFVEDPLVAAQFSWNEAYGYLACHHCLRPLETVEENVKRLTNNSNIIVPLPKLCSTDQSKHRACELCEIQFCSDVCKELAFQQYHNAICFAKKPSLLGLCEKWKKIHYPPETTSIMLLLKIIGMVEQAEGNEELMNRFLNFSHGSSDEREGMLLKLFGPENSEKLKILHTQLTQSLSVRHAGSLVSEEGMKSLFALIGRNGQGIGTSVFSEWVKVVEKHEMSNEDKERTDNFIDAVYQAMDEYVGTFLNTEGSGLYETQRCINHSCSPNAVVTFPYSNSTLLLQAKTNIEPGDEICISYLDDCQLERSRHSRNKDFRDYYLFECTCEKCLSQLNDPDVTSEEESEEEVEDMDC